MNRSAQVLLNEFYGGILHSLIYVILASMHRKSKMKINKETEALSDTIDQIDLIDIYRTFHPKTADYTSFSSAHRTFSRIDHI